MTGDVALTSALRNNLLSLQDTQRQVDQTQFRLSTGKKVNSALDNPLNFFRAQSFSDRASDLTTLLDGINLSIRTIEEADKGITAINKLLDTAESIIDEAKSAYNGSDRNIGTIRGLISTSTTTGVATTGMTLDDLAGGIEGVGAGDTIDFTIEAFGTTTTIQIAAGDSITDVVNALNQTTVFGNNRQLLNATFADGELSIAVNTGFEVSDIESIDVTVNDAGAADPDAEVNFGGTIIRDTSGQTPIYAGLYSQLENLESRYDKILTEISATANDSSFNGINLLKGNDLLTVFNEEGTSNLNTTGDDLTATGLGLSVADFSTRANVDTRSAQLDDATTTVRDFGGLIATDLSLIQTRRNFTEQTIETLKAGSDDLTLADLNEEGANLLALQTRQQLGVTSLSLASQAQQGVLRLF
ncbi:MAG: flagellin [Alphaproteobacteria bacterium]